MKRLWGTPSNAKALTTYENFQLLSVEKTYHSTLQQEGQNKSEIYLFVCWKRRESKWDLGKVEWWRSFPWNVLVGKMLIQIISSRNAIRANATLEAHWNLFWKSVNNSSCRQDQQEIAKDTWVEKKRKEYGKDLTI